MPAAEGHGLSWRSHNLLHRQDPETGAQLWGVRFDSPAVAAFTANGTSVAVHRAPQATSSLAAPAGRFEQVQYSSISSAVSVDGSALLETDTLLAMQVML